MGFLARARTSIASVFKPTPGQIQVAASMVRPLEANSHYGRQGQYQALELVGMFAGVVKCAASRNAAGIASNPIRVYRKAKGAQKSKCFGGREVRPTRVKALARSGGLYARKALASMDDDIEEVTDPLHPLVAFLNSVNAVHNPFETMEGTELGLGLTGNHYWKLAFDSSTGFPVEYWPLHAQHVHPVPDRKRIVSGYVYGRGTETEALYDADEVVAFKRVNPRGDPYFGMGDLAACVAEARLGFQFVAIAQAMIDNGMQSGGVLQGPFTPEQRQQLEVSMQARNAGPQNAGRYMILSVPDTAKFTSTPMGEKEVAFLSSSERVDSVVSYCFDIPIEFLQMRPGGLGSEGNPGIEQWQMYGLKPRGQKIEDTINARVVPLFQDEGLFVAFDPWVNEDDTKYVEQVRGLWNDGLLRKNEARIEAGFDADLEAEDGDDYKAPEVSPFGGGGFGEDPPAPGEKPKPKPEPKEPADEKAIKRSAAMLEACGLDSCCTKPVSRKDRVLDTIVATERQLEAALRAFFNGVTPQVVNSTGENGLGMSLANSSAIEAEFRSATADLLGKLYAAGTAAGVNDLTGMMDVGKLNDALTAGAAGKLRDYQGQLIRSVSATLDRRIRDTLAEGIGRETVTQLRDRVQEVMTSASKYAAERIARTESSRAFLTAREDAWSASGVVEGKQWVLSSDPCEFCVAMSETYKVAKLGADFVPFGSVLEGVDGGKMVMDYLPLKTPPVHPQCRCSMRLVAKGNA